MPSHVHANQKAIVCPARALSLSRFDEWALILTGPAEHEHGRGKWIESGEAVEVVKRRWIHFVLSFFRPFFRAMMLCHGSFMAEGSLGLVECRNLFLFSDTEEMFSFLQQFPHMVA